MLNSKEIYVTKASLPKYEEYCEKIKRIWDTHWLTNSGDYHCELEEKLSQYLLSNKLSLFTNGHLALETAIEALELEGEIITTPFTFASTTHAIFRKGIKPVFCDINEDDYTIDATQIEKLITKKTSAILPVHVYGNVCDVHSIDRIGKDNNLKVIYDAAHAFGVKIDGKGVSEFGDISMFSFHATKVFNTIEGGALAYGNSELKNRIDRIKNFGILNAEEIISVGGNAKMNEFQAAMGLCNLENLSEDIAKRKRIVECYRENLEGVEGIVFLKDKPNVVSNYAYFPIRVDQKRYGRSRNELFELLASHHVFTRKYFYPLTNQFKCYEKIFDVNNTPVAKKVAEQILTLPLYPDLSLQDVNRICKYIKVGANNE